MIVFDINFLLKAMGIMGLFRKTLLSQTLSLEVMNIYWKIHLFLLLLLQKVQFPLKMQCSYHPIQHIGISNHKTMFWSLV